MQDLKITDKNAWKMMHMKLTDCSVNRLRLIAIGLICYSFDAAFFVGNT